MGCMKGICMLSSDYQSDSTVKNRGGLGKERYGADNL